MRIPEGNQRQLRSEHEHHRKLADSGNNARADGALNVEKPQPVGQDGIGDVALTSPRLPREPKSRRAADAVVKLISSLGGYAVLPVNTTLAPSAAWPAHVTMVADGVLRLFGAAFYLGPSASPRA